ncbi:MFS transporter [Gordonia sp. PS3]|uniref:MFS transporter n=1 Tax=Gordonia TaxID=2053 RepID=UPI000785C081|nr:MULTISPECIES: MFS transporter [Gordonia]MBY4571431.1 MFS transporter [Gordonia sihwensis]
MVEQKTGPEALEKAPATGAVVAVLALAGIVVSLMQTLVIPIIPHLPEYLNAPASNTAWVITATLLAAAVATPVMGRLGDMFGKRRMMLVSMGIMIVGSVIGALSTSVVPMIVGRALQGLAAGVIPLGISVMRDVLPKEKLAGAVATMSASLGVGGAFGLPLAALIAEYADWHWLFWVSAIMGVVGAIAVVIVVPESPEKSGGGFDYVGAVTLSGGLLALLLAVSKGADWGWSSGTTLGCFAAAIVLFILWVSWELRSSQPIVDVRVAVRPQVLFTNIASIVFGFAMFAASMVFPQVVQMPEATGYGLGGSMMVAGLVMAPFGIMLLLAAPLSSWLTNTFGPRITLMVGAIVVALGYLLGVFALHSIWQLIVIGIIIGFGTGLAYGAMPALIMGAVPPSQTGAANSFNTLMRSLGTSFASALAGVIVAQMTMTLGGVAVPSESAFRWIMALAAGAAVAALVLAFFIPGRSDAPGGAATGSEETVDVAIEGIEQTV